MLKDLTLVVIALLGSISLFGQKAGLDEGAAPYRVVSADLEAGYPTNGLDVRPVPANSSPDIQPAVDPIEPIQAVAVQEPLQRKSLSAQRIWRAHLLSDLSRILPARDTSRGFVITIPESYFSRDNDVPAFTAEKLARIIEMLPPDVSIRVEGYTDDLGSAAQNQAAACGRAEAVRDLLVENDSATRIIPATGFVSSARIAGRVNQRVDIVVSGRGIGPAIFPGRAYALAR